MALPPLEFLFFALTLTGVALFHKRALTIALTGLAVTVVYKLAFAGFSRGTGLAGLGAHFAHEWVILANLMLLLVGFAMVARHFEESNLPHAIPRYLPSGWAGAFSVLAMVFMLSAFLDNIAGAVIGGIVAKHVYRDRVCIGYVASIVAAANAGGAGSVVGDTTTTMMWLGGVSPLHLLWAYVAAVSCFFVFASFGAWQQARYAPTERHESAPLEIDWSRLGVVAVTLVAIISANVSANLLFPGLEEFVPVLGIAIWVALLVMLFVRRPDWTVAPEAAKGALFLVALVALASLMPVASLPPPSVYTTLGLGFLSAVFDNIPLTALALTQGGYDWPMLAYAVGFGGSMIWFGSSAGVALTQVFPEGRSVVQWLRQSWYIPLAYLVGFGVMLAVCGWNPQVLSQTATPAH